MTAGFVEALVESPAGVVLLAELEAEAPKRDGVSGPTTRRLMG